MLGCTRRVISLGRLWLLRVRSSIKKTRQRVTRKTSKETKYIKTKCSIKRSVVWQSRVDNCKREICQSCRKTIKVLSEVRWLTLKLTLISIAISQTFNTGRQRGTPALKRQLMVNIPPNLLDVHLWIQNL